MDRIAPVAMMTFRVRLPANSGVTPFVAVAGMRIVPIVAVEILIAADIFTQPQQFLLGHRALHLDIPLQGLSFLDLFEYQRVLLCAVTAIGFESFPLVLRLDPGILSGPTVPDTGKAFGQTLRPLLPRFCLPALFMGG